MAGLYKIGLASRMTGVSIPTLRLWEEEYGLLAPQRSLGGTRLYSPADIERARRIRRLALERGYSLQGLLDVLDQPDDGVIPSSDLDLHILLRRLVRSQRAREVAWELVKGLQGLTGVETATAGLYERRSHSLCFVTSRLWGTRSAPRPPIPVSDLPSMWQRALDAGEPYSDPDVHRLGLKRELSARLDEVSTRSFHAEPLSVAGQLVGVLIIASPLAAGISNGARQVCERLAVPAGPLLAYLASR